MIAQSVGFLAGSTELTLFVFFKNEKVNLDKYKNIGCQRIVFLQLPGFFGILRNFIFRVGRAAQENLYFSYRVRKKIRDDCREADVQVVVADMLRVAPYIDGFSGRRVVDLDDLLSDRYKKFAASARSVLGTFSTRLPSIFRKIEPVIRVFLLNREARIMQKRENAAPAEFDAVLLTSRLEASRLVSATGANNVFDNPPAVNLDRRSWRFVGDVDKVCHALFLGNIRTAQNYDSLQFILKDVLSSSMNGSDIFLHVVGEYDQAAADSIAQYKNVKLYGFVDDVAEVVSRCDVALLPVAFGTGIKTKILDAFSFGIPVITNRVGSEGLDVVSGVHAFVLEDGGEIARLAVQLKDRVLAERISDAAYTYVASNHDKSTLKLNYLKHVLGPEWVTTS